tara:strand:- start:233 stop:403 length:171 start_codon:yes stop_codon:yes gene_type:complete
MKNSIKTISILTLVIALISSAFYFAPKGNDFIEYEKDMVESGQIKAENSFYHKNIK